MRSKRGMILFLGLLLLADVLLFKVIPPVRGSESQPTDSADIPVVPVFLPEELAVYDGEDPDKPIYLALDGLVYDVTPGKEFYQTGGSYHMLAGTDASALLHIAGADIIRKKYRVVGMVANDRQ